MLVDGHGRVADHSDVTAEELDLIHGLVGAGVLQLGRTVAAQHQQRHPLQRCLHHRRPHVGQGTAGGGEDHCRHPGRPPVPQGMEGRAALVVVDDAPGPAVWRATATTSGVLREPGATQNVSIPLRTSSSISSVAHRWLMIGGLQVSHRGRLSAWVKWLIL